MFCMSSEYNWVLFSPQSLSSSCFWKSLFEVLEWMTARDSLWQHFPVLASLVWWLPGEKQEGHFRPSLLSSPTMAAMLAKLFRYFFFFFFQVFYIYSFLESYKVPNYSIILISGSRNSLLCLAQYYSWSVQWWYKNNR